MMNSSVPPPVEPGIAAPRRDRATLWRLLATVLCLGVHGCTEATGGAVELSWALRSTRDVDIADCLDDRPDRIGRIRLWWQTTEQLRFESFPCRDNHGITSFDLPVVEPDHTVALYVTPECADGSQPDPASYVTPPPIVRSVEVGETITLDAILLVLRIDEADCVTLPCVCR